MVDTFPEEIERVFDNARYWKNANILSNKYVIEIIIIILKRIDNKLEFLDELMKNYSEEERLLMVPAIMVLKDLRKEFKGEIDNEKGRKTD